MAAYIALCLHAWQPGSSFQILDVRQTGIYS
jgi:hypothetical protein